MWLFLWHYNPNRFWNGKNNGFGPFIVLMHVDLWEAVVPFRLMSKSREPSFYNEFRDCSQTYNSDFIRVQGKGAQAIMSVSTASHPHKTWAEVTSSAPHPLHKGLSISPLMSKCLLRVLCPARRPVTTLAYILLENSSLNLAAGLGPRDQFSSLSPSTCKTQMERRRSLCWGF